MGDRPDFPRQRDFAKPHRLRRQRLVRQRGNQCGGHGKVRRRVGQPIAARDIEIDFGGREIEPATRLEHGEQHREAPAVPPHHRAARSGPALQAHDQRLNLDKHRARAFHRREHRGTRHRILAAREEQGGRVADFGQSLPFHRKDPDLIHRTEAVLDRAQDAVLVAALPLESHDHVDHVFQHARASNAAILGHVADQHQRRAAFLGIADQFEGRGADLADRAGGAFNLIGMHGLDRIDHQQRRGFHLAERGENIAHRSGRGELDRRRAQTKPLCPQAHLPGGFLTADIDHAAARFGDAGCGLQQQGRLADARIAAHQHGGTGHQPAAQRAVKLG